MSPLVAWRPALRERTVWLSLVIMLAFGAVAVLAPRLAPHDPYQFGPTQVSLPPMWVQSGSNPGWAEFPLGTDRYGRDILSRFLYGTRTAVCLSLLAVGLAALIGAAVGLVSGYAGGRLDAGIKLLTDTILCLPGIMFTVIVILILRELLRPTWANGLLTLVVGFAGVAWVGLARLVRMSVLQLKSQLFVEAAVSVGVPPRRIITHHLLPNVVHIIVVWVINNVPAVILLEAVLGYIGVGITGAVDGGEFTTVSWGGLFFSGRSAINSNPLVLILPSACILVISMSFILLGDFLSGFARRPQS